MDIFRIVGIAAAAAVLALTVKSYRPELGIQTAAAGGALILLLCISQLTEISSVLKTSLFELGLDEDAVLPVIKVAGIAFVSQIGADICRDAGETALASKTELCGRILMVSAALPTLTKLVKLLSGLINEYL